MLSKYASLNARNSEAINRKKQKVSLYTRFDEIEILQSMSELERGHRIMDNVRETMAKIDEFYPRTHHQRKVSTLVLAAYAGYIYGNVFEKNRKKIMEYNGFTDTKLGVALRAFRRAGKSMTIAIITSAIFLNVPGCEILIVAEGTRAAGADTGLLQKIKTIFGNLKFTSYDHKKEHLVAEFPDRRAIHAYSSHIEAGYVYLKVSVCFFILLHFINAKTFSFFFLVYNTSSSAT